MAKIIRYQHRGWTVRPLRSGRWQARVRVRADYLCETFDTKTQATEWATAKAAVIRAAVIEGRMPHVVSGPVLTVQVAAAYSARLAARNRSPQTLADVRLILAACAAAVPDLGAATAPADLATWLDSLSTSGRGRGGTQAPVSPARRNKYLMTVRGMCRWAVRQRPPLLRDDPSTTLESAAVAPFLKPHFSLAELRAMLHHAQSKTGRWVALMVYAGLCADEARCLRYGDLDWEGRCIVVRADCGARIKRGRERIIPMQDELAMLLSPPGPPDMPVAGLGPGNLPRAFHGFLTSAGVPIQGRSAHSCRHTYTAMMIATGVPTSMVGSHLGHRVAQTTLGYAKLAPRYQTAVQSWRRGEIRLAGDAVAPTAAIVHEPEAPTPSRQPPQ